MQNLILNLFNIQPEDIEHFSSVNYKDGSVECRIRLRKKRIYCPVCGCLMSLNGIVRKPVNHQVLTGRNCSLLYEARRYRCLKCGHSEQEKNPFSLKGFSTSIFVLDQIMRDLHNPRLNYTMIAQRYHMSVNQVINYFDSFVVIPPVSLPQNLGIDEIHSKMARRRDASYLGILTDNDHFNLIDVLSSRNKTDLNNFFQRFSKQERDRVKYVTIDMWEPYRDLAQKWLSNSVVAVDSFHVIEHLTLDFNRIRARIMNSYVRGSVSYYLLKRWNRLLLSDRYDLQGEKKYNHILKARVNYGDILKMILELSDELTLAYRLKQRYRHFNSTFTYENAENELNLLISAFQTSGIREYEEFFQLLIHWKKEIINSFIISEGNGSRLSNARAESMNRGIQGYIGISYGLSNFRRFRARMLYCFNDHLFYNLTQKITSLKRNFKKGDNSII